MHRRPRSRPISLVSSSWSSDPPIDANAHRLAVFQRNVDDLRELRVTLGLETDIARVDAVFFQRCRAVRIVGQQLVADIVKVADQRHGDPDALQTVANARHLGRGFRPVDCNANDFRSGTRQGGNLGNRCIRIRCVGVGHRLDYNGRIAANGHSADLDRNGRAARKLLCKIIDHRVSPNRFEAAVAARCTVLAVD